MRDFVSDWWGILAFIGVGLILIFIGLFAPMSNTDLYLVDGELVATVCKKFQWFGQWECAILETGLVP